MLTFIQVEEIYNIPPGLLESVCITESAGADGKPDPLALHFQDGGYENSSFGMCQVTYRAAAAAGWNVEPCKSFQRNQKRTTLDCPLFHPGLNMLAAGNELGRYLRRYKEQPDKAVAAYNAGAARYERTGNKHRFRNQKYVTKVMSTWSRLKERRKERRRIIK